MLTQERFRSLSNFAPIFGIAITYAVYRLYFIVGNINSFRGTSSIPRFSGQAVGFEADVERFVALLSWGVTGAVFLLAFVAAVSVLYYILNVTSAIEKLRSNRRVSIYLVVILAGIAASSLGGSPFAVDALNDVVVESIEKLGLDITFRNADLEIGMWLFNIFTPMMLVFTSLLAICSSAILMYSTYDAENQGRSLRAQFRLLNILLFTGAVLLVAGIVHANAIYNLPGTYFREPDLQLWQTLVTALSTGSGAVWTLILISIYLPSIGVLRLRTRSVAKAAVERKESDSVRTWTEKHGLTFRAPQRLAQLAALVSPLIAGGPGSPLLGLLGS